MLRKIVYFIFCLLWFTTMKAQQVNKVNPLLETVRKNLKTLYEDTTATEECRKSIKDLAKDFSQISAKTLTDIIVDNLHKKYLNLLVVAKRADVVECYNSGIATLLHSAENLDGELKKQTDILKHLKDSTIAGRQKKDTTVMVTVKIEVRDSANAAVLNASVNIDSLGTAIDRLHKTDSGSYEVLLVKDGIYTVNVDGDGYASYQTELVGKNERDTMLVRLEKLPANTIPTAAGSHDVRAATPSFSMVKTIFLVSVVLLFILTIWATISHLKTLNYKVVSNTQAAQAVTMENNQPTLESVPINDQFMEAIVPLPADPLPTDPLPADPLPADPMPIIETVDEPVEETILPEKEIVEQPVLAKEEELAPLNLVVEKDRIVQDVPPNRYFVCEVMMTAGPRKKFMSEENADKDLGEDVCGFVSNGNEVFIWLLDGTSDLHCLKHPESKREYFSSRLLAQSVAGKLRNFFMSNPGMAFADMIIPAIQEVRANWLLEIERLPSTEQELLKTAIDKKNFPECATTLLIAGLKLNGDFSSYRTGDSKLFLFDAVSNNGVVLVQTLFEDKNVESNDRIFFRLWINAQGKFDILYNEPLHETENKKNISTIISFSDGIGLTTEKVLKDDYKNDPERVRKEIIYQSQETGDDKTIYFIEIKELR